VDGGRRQRRPRCSWWDTREVMRNRGEARVLMAASLPDAGDDRTAPGAHHAGRRSRVLA
jgi:hypothetical protein